MAVTEVPLKPIRSASRSAQVAESLREAIYSGRLQPGQPVREMQLARDLQVSQTTIREALLQLEHAGLVTRHANRGSHVTKLTAQDVQERVQLRVSLEQIAAAEAARRATAEDVADLERRLDAITGAVHRNAYYEAGQADLEFHRALWRLSGNQTLYRILDDLTVPLFAFVSMVHSRSLDNLETRSRRHEPILAAIRKRSAAAARKAIGEHIARSYRNYKGDDEKPVTPRRSKPR